MLSERARSILANPKPAVTDEAIREFEDGAGVKLPADYREFLKESNGAGFAIPCEGHISTLGGLKEVSEILPGSLGYELPDRVYMIGTDGGGEAYCYNFRFNPPYLASVDLEKGDGREEAYYGASFDGFLCHLANHSTEPKPKGTLKKAPPPAVIDQSTRIIPVNPCVSNDLSGLPLMPLASIAISPDNRIILAGGRSHDLLNNKARKLALMRQPSAYVSPMYFFINAGSRYIACRCIPGGTPEAAVLVCENDTDTEVAGYPERPGHAAISCDGRLLAFVPGGRPSVVTLLAVDQMALQGELNIGGEFLIDGKVASGNKMQTVALSASGDLLAASHSDRYPSENSVLSVFDTSKRQIITEDTHTGRITCLAYFADGRLLVGNFKRGVSVVDSAGNEILTIADPSRSLLTCQVVGPEQDRIVFTTQTGVIEVHDLTGKLLERLRGPKGATDVATASCDGKILVTGGAKHAKLRMWDLTV